MIPYQQQSYNNHGSQTYPQQQQSYYSSQQDMSLQQMSYQNQNQHVQNPHTSVVPNHNGVPAVGHLEPQDQVPSHNHQTLGPSRQIHHIQTVQNSTGSPNHTSNNLGNHGRYAPAPTITSHSAPPQHVQSHAPPQPSASSVQNVHQQQQHMIQHISSQHVQNTQSLQHPQHVQPIQQNSYPTHAQQMSHSNGTNSSPHQQRSQLPMNSSNQSHSAASYQTAHFMDHELQNQCQAQHNNNPVALASQNNHQAIHQMNWQTNGLNSSPGQGQGTTQGRNLQAPPQISNYHNSYYHQQNNVALQTFQPQQYSNQHHVQQSQHVQQQYTPYEDTTMALQQSNYQQQQRYGELSNHYSNATQMSQPVHNKNNMPNTHADTSYSAHDQGHYLSAQDRAQIIHSVSNDFQDQGGARIQKAAEIKKYQIKKSSPKKNATTKAAKIPKESPAKAKNAAIRKKRVPKEMTESQRKSGYAQFFSDRQKEIKSQISPNLNSLDPEIGSRELTFGEISKIVSAEWSSLSDEDKNKYNKGVTEKRRENLSKKAAEQAKKLSSDCMS